MHDLTPFERRLSERLAAELASSVRPFDAQAVAASAIGRRRTTYNRRSVLLLVAATAALVALVGVIVAGSGILNQKPVPKHPALPWPLAGVVAHPGSVTLHDLVGAVVLADGRVFVVGYTDDSGKAAAEIWDQTTDTATPTPAMIRDRVPWSMVRLADGRVLITGGDSQENDGPTAEIFDPETMAFTLLDSRPSTIESSAVLLRDGRVLLSGGYTTIEPDLNGNREVSFQAELFDPATNTFSPTPPMNRRRTGHTMQLLSDGRVLLLGGSVNSARAPLQGQPSVEVFDPATGRFEVPAGQIVVNQVFDRWATLSDDRVVVLRQPGSGTYPFRYLPMTLHAYNPGTGVESDGPTIPASAPFYDVQAMVRLSDSRVLLYGSDKASSFTTPNGDSGAKSWVGVLDVDTGEFAQVGVLPASSGTVLPLPGGRVLILGGFERSQCATEEGGLWACSNPSSAIEMVR